MSLVCWHIKKRRPQLRIATDNTEHKDCQEKSACNLQKWGKHPIFGQCVSYAKFLLDRAHEIADTWCNGQTGLPPQRRKPDTKKDFTMSQNNKHEIVSGTTTIEGYVLPQLAQFAPNMPAGEARKAAQAEAIVKWTGELGKIIAAHPEVGTVLAALEQEGYGKYSYSNKDFNALIKPFYRKVEQSRMDVLRDEMKEAQKAKNYARVATIAAELATLNK